MNVHTGFRYATMAATAISGFAGIGAVVYTNKIEYLFIPPIAMVIGVGVFAITEMSHASKQRDEFDERILYHRQRVFLINKKKKKSE